ncbi:benzoate/H(+) symporter BenE family transporter [Rhodoferax sp.]|jgi:benzoate membrane transport protein|uniref:benzoate/H(+) symporter BenE family transporter n=1 Tax=Rhodoferax sp. TaxID=50421 RepID=UPI003783C0D2
MQFFKDLSLSACAAGFVAVLVGFTSSIAIVFQAAQSFGATPAIMASWMWAIGLGMGLCTLLPSLWLRKPVMVAWSTPGAAVLASAGLAGGFGMADAVGAFMVSALLVVLVGWTGWFERLMSRIPVAIASALLAGALARFGLSAFSAAETAAPLVVVMLLAYLLGKRTIPRYAVPATLLVAVVFAALTTGFTPTDIRFGLTYPVWVTPTVSLAGCVSLALPLFIVTMASQNLPGVAAIQACGYGDRRALGGDAGIPVSKVITLTGVATFVLAPFGAFALNLSAITAAICMGPEAHADPKKRYTASAVCGALYILIGLFGATIIGVLTAFPKELVSAIAGLALISTIAAALRTALDNPAHREAAMVTFLVTLSGVVLAGVGSAFWGVVAGAIALAIQQYGAPEQPGP